MHFELNAAEHPELLTRQGQVEAIGMILDSLRERGEDLPDEVQIDATFPEPGAMDEMARGIDKLNKVIEPRGFMDKIAHQAFRSMSGVSGNLRPIRYQCNAGGQAHTVQLAMDLSGLSQEDVRKFADFLGKNAHKLG